MAEFSLPSSFVGLAFPEPRNSHVCNVGVRADLGTMIEATIAVNIPLLP